MKSIFINIKKNNYAIKILFLIMFVIWVDFLYHISLLWIGNSDNANTLLAASAIAHGNLNLKGWNLSSDTFYFTMMLPMAIIIKFIGFHAYVYNLVGTILFLLLFFVSKNLILNYSNNIENSYYVAMLLLIATLGFPIANYAYWILQGYHVGNAVFTLVTMLMVSNYINKNKPSALMLIFIVLLVALAITDDPTYEITALLPMAITVMISLVQKKEISKKNIFFVFLSLVSGFLIGKLILKIIMLLGGFTTGSSSLYFSIVDLNELGIRFQLLITDLLNLFDANIFGSQLLNVSSIIHLIHFVGLTYFIYTVYSFIKHNTRNDLNWYLSVPMVLALLFNLLAFLLGTHTDSISSSRYLITSQVIGYLMMTVVSVRIIINIKLSSVAKYLGIILFLLFNIIVFVHTSFYGIQTNPMKFLGDWLLEHKFEFGYAPYWDASIMNMVTNNKVNVSQIQINNNDFITPYNTLNSIFNPSFYSYKTNFLLVPDNPNSGEISEPFINAAERTFGSPSKEYVVDLSQYQNAVYWNWGRPINDNKFIILVWNHTISFNNMPSFFFNGSKIAPLYTTIGEYKISDNKNMQLISKGSNNSGWFVYGPYITLTPGEYRVEYSFPNHSLKNHFKSEISVSCNNGESVIVEKNTKANQPIIISFHTINTLDDVEFRVFKNPGSDLIIKSILIKRVGE
jgi:hypothetical protein